MKIVAILTCAIVYYLLPDAVLENIVSTGFTACKNIADLIYSAVSALIK